MNSQSPTQKLQAGIPHLKKHFSRISIILIPAKKQKLNPGLRFILVLQEAQFWF